MVVKRPVETFFGYNVAPIHEDLEKEPIPHSTAPTGNRNGMPEPGGYHYDPAGKARELEVSKRLEVIREEALRHMAATPMVFTDPITGQPCELITAPKVGVKHPGCDRLADLAAQLDAFYCTQCRMNGRISGAWAMNMVRLRPSNRDN